MKLSKQLLHKEYWTNKQSMYKIAKKYKISVISVFRHFRLFNLKSRTRSEAMRGINNPMFGTQRLDLRGNKNPQYKPKKRQNCSCCGKFIYVYPYRVKMSNNFFCDKSHFYLWKRQHINGVNNPNWKNGLSRFPYAIDFSIKTKEIIRKRDNYKCQNCGKNQNQELKQLYKKLSVHHIDYNKQNCKQSNLITLCQSCNSHVNSNRNYWKKYFRRLVWGRIE